VEELLLSLDGAGLLPWNGEKAEDFMNRGLRTLRSSRSDRWSRELINVVRERYPGRGVGYKNFDIAQDTRRVRRFRKGVEAFGQTVGADLSWLPIVQYWQSEFDRSHTHTGTIIAFFAALPGTESGYYLPFLGVNTTKLTFSSAYDSGAHEAFHMIRKPLFGPIYLAGAREFDHLGGLIISPVKRWLAYDTHERQFRAAWRELRRAFGKDAGYVMARLSYDELVEKILEKFKGRDPRQYITWAAGFEHNLRHRIMAERLGL